jgi:hypothetical protein
MNDGLRFETLALETHLAKIVGVPQHVIEMTGVETMIAMMAKHKQPRSVSLARCAFNSSRFLIHTEIRVSHFRWISAF